LPPHDAGVNHTADAILLLFRARGDFMSAVETRKVDRDEAGMRLDRWFKLHFPGLGFGHLQKLLRSGQVRVNGARVETSTRLAAGQEVRVPPLQAGDARKSAPAIVRRSGDREVLEAAILHEDQQVIVLNKPAGLAVQGGSGVTRHVDAMLESFTDRQGRKPKLVHRLDRDTAGVLVVARTRSAAAALGKSFKARRAAASPLTSSRRRGPRATACASPGTATAAPTTPSRTMRLPSRPAKKSPGW
jgi:23S rRNA-/tRNA-specific pseudouridylate synthase